MAKNEKIELVSSRDSKTGVAGRNVNDVFIPGKSVKPIAPITPSQLSGDAVPVNIPAIPPATGAQALQSQLEDQTDQFTQNLETASKTAETAKSSSLDAYLNTLLSTQGETELKAQEAAREGGTDEIQVELNKINQDILTEQHANRRALEALEKNPQGLFGTALNDEMNRINSESLKRQADLSIVQMGVQGRFDSAKEIADRAVQVQLEQSARILQARGMIYEDVKDTWKVADRRAFEAKQADRQRSLDQQRADAETLQSTKLQAMQMAQLNGAPPDVLRAIQSAETPEDVLRLGGQWGSVDMLDRALKNEQLSSLRTKKEVLAPTSVIDQGGRKMLINTQTGEVIKDFGITDIPVNELAQAAEQQAISQLDDLKSHKGMRKAVGVGKLARFTPFRIDVQTGEVADFIAGIDEMTKALTLEQLATAKERGITFGALNQSELNLVAEAATKINNWREGDRNSEGAVIKTSHYEVSEKLFMDELDKISNFRKLDAVLKGADPESVGVVETDDGYWVRNGDGQLEQIREK